MKRSIQWRRGLAIVIAAAVAGVSATTVVHAQDVQPETPEVPQNPYFDVGPAEGSGSGMRIGYISLGPDPFVGIVSASIREQAAVAGVDLFECDANFDPDEAIVCARQLASAGVRGVLNFQSVADVSGQVCSAHGSLPTIAIDIHQDPCEISFVGVDNGRAGFVAGAALAEHLVAESECAYDLVFVLGAGFVGAVGTERMGGLTDGFESVCGQVPDEQARHIDVGGSTDITFELMSAELEAAPKGGVYVILAINNQVGRGVADAAKALDRQGELRIASQGAEASLEALACEPYWITSTAYFPDRYGHTLIAAMIDFLNGERLPTELFTPHVAITADNVRDLFPDTPACV